MRWDDPTLGHWRVESVVPSEENLEQDDQKEQHRSTYTTPRHLIAEFFLVFDAWLPPGRPSAEQVI
jgi:hypothetical protein